MNRRTGFVGALFALASLASCGGAPAISYDALMMAYDNAHTESAPTSVVAVLYYVGTRADHDYFEIVRDGLSVTSYKVLSSNTHIKERCAYGAKKTVVMKVPRIQYKEVIEGKGLNGY